MSSTSSINSLSSSYLQYLLAEATQAVGSATGGSSASAIGQGSDSGTLSPFAQVMSTLQQLQQSNPTQYAQVTSQIATNLQTAAQSAQSSGNTTAANQLNQLASDFKTASTSGQLPNIQDLAQAMSGQGGGGGVSGHHHRHHHHSESSSTSSSSDSSSSDSSTTSSTSSSDALNQLLSALETYTNQTDSLNPYNIIMNTLVGAGVTGSTTATS